MPTHQSGVMYAYIAKKHPKTPSGASLQAFFDSYLNFELHCMRATFSRALFTKTSVPKAHSTNKIEC